MLGELCAGHAYFMPSMTEVSCENDALDSAGKKARRGGQAGDVSHVLCFITFRKCLRRGHWVSLLSLPQKGCRKKALLWTDLEGSLLTNSSILRRPRVGMLYVQGSTGSLWYLRSQKPGCLMVRSEYSISPMSGPKKWSMVRTKGWAGPDLALIFGLGKDFDFILRVPKSHWKG